MLGYLLYGLRILKDIRAKGALDSDAKLPSSNTCQIFFIDFTETIFLGRQTYFDNAGDRFLVGFARQPIPADAPRRREVERARPLRGTRSWRDPGRGGIGARTSLIPTLAIPRAGQRRLT